MRCNISAILAQDWSAACRTRVPTGRADYEREFSSCEQGFSVLFGGDPAAREFLADARVGDVRVRGKTAEVDVVQPGQTRPAATLAAVERDGKWYLRDTSDAEIP
jgi:hypothetical protein